MPGLARPSSAPPAGAPAPPDATAVCDAYALGRPLGRPTFAARGELGRIWRMETSIGTWAVQEIFRPGSGEDRGRATFWIEDVAANAFTLARIDGWLAAVSEYDVPRSSSHREDA